MRRCTRCIMPETVPGISFNRDEVCCFCLDYEEGQYLGQEALQEMILAAKTEGNEYDCIVPLSGLYRPVFT